MLLFTMLRKSWIERELYEGSIDSVAEALAMINLKVTRSCRWPLNPSYFSLVTGKGLDLLVKEGRLSPEEDPRRVAGSLCVTSGDPPQAAT